MRSLLRIVSVFVVFSYSIELWAEDSHAKLGSLVENYIGASFFGEELGGGSLEERLRDKYRELDFAALERELIRLNSESGEIACVYRDGRFVVVYFLFSSLNSENYLFVSFGKDDSPDGGIVGMVTHECIEKPFGVLIKHEPWKELGVVLLSPKEVEG